MNYTVKVQSVAMIAMRNKCEIRVEYRLLLRKETGTYFFCKCLFILRSTRERVYLFFFEVFACMTAATFGRPFFKDVVAFYTILM